MALAVQDGRLAGTAEERNGRGKRKSGASAEPVAADQTRLRVLVVEDEAIVAMSLEAVLEQFGHEVAGTVATGRGAVAEAARIKPDVVLMDVRLADSLDGISAAQQILGEQPVGIVFITAYSDAGTVARIRELGAPILSKPVAAEALRKAIAEARPPGGAA